MKKLHEGSQRKASGASARPRVGIFWLLNGKPIIDSAPPSEAEPYGDHLNHPRGHAAVWKHYQRVGTVPAEMEYEEGPRGRVMFNTKTQRFTFLADRCISQRQERG